MDISLIIPCYNEENNVAAFFDASQKVFSSLGVSYEYVFVNDGSNDNTKKVLSDLYSNHPESNIVVVNFSRNFGKEAAIYAGLKNSIGDYTCIIDVDLQQRPEVAADMYNMLAMNKELDCVCAYQDSRKEGKMISALKSVFYKTMNAVTETEVKNGASDFRMFNSKVKDAMLSMGEYHRFTKGIFSWIGFNVEYLEYEVQERNDGKSKWSLIKLIKYAISGIVAFSTAPLKFSTCVGGISVVFSVIYGIVTIIRKIAHDINVDGFTQLALLITFFSGVLLFSVGIIGEYIAKIYQQVKNRPIYIVDEILSPPNRDSK